MSYPPPAAAGQALPQVAPQQQKVQAMPAQVHTAAPIIVNGSGPDTKPEKSNTPLIIFLVSLFTGFCCPCGFGYWVGSEIECVLVILQLSVHSS